MMIEEREEIIKEIGGTEVGVGMTKVIEKEMIVIVVGMMEKMIKRIEIDQENITIVV